ncbi:hypothetical protein GCM10027296_29370 [Chitinimonas naiadis]
MPDQPPPYGDHADRFEARIRIACGALLGLLTAILLAVTATQLSALVLIPVSMVLIALSAYLALIYGDEFWGFLLRLLR